jgi:hypothetical protein
MTDTQKGGVALIAGALGGLVTMFTHPVAQDMFVPGRFARVETIDAISHSIALASFGALILGAICLYRRLDAPDHLALAGLVFYCIGVTAGIMATVLSGFVAPQVGRAILQPDSVQHDLWQVLLRYTFVLNQAFSLIHVFASWLAIFLWSCAVLRGRQLAPSLALYGLAVGSLILLLVASGHLPLHLHGFMIVVLAQGIWYVMAGTALYRMHSITVD